MKILEGSFLWLALAAALLLWPSVGETQQRMRFDRPAINNIPVDWCLTWGQNCGKPAADYFCQTRGYQHSDDFGVVNNIGRTVILKTRQVCNHPTCDGFSYVSCVRRAQAAPPPRAGRSYEECLYRFCGMCRQSISLLDVAADPRCEDCKRRMGPQIRACMEGR